MFARALIVVLVALNLGVAAWWLLRPAPPVPVPPVSDQGGVALRLLPMPAATTPAGTAPAAADAAPVASTATGDAPVTADEAATVAATPAAAPVAPAATPPHCLRLGPFPDRDAAQVAQTGLGALLREATLHQDVDSATGYRVLLPPLADRAQAQAAADRIAAAGFQDFLILRQGAEANGIALGTYRSRDTADRRVAALRAAGFPAEIRAQGAAAGSRWWLDGATTDAAAVRATFPGAQDRDCAAR